MKTTYDSLVGVISTAVRGGQCGGALLSIPGGQALLRGAADGDGVDAVCVPITVTVIALTPPIPRSPDEDGALSLSPLKEKPEYITPVITYCGHTPIKSPTNTCTKFSETVTWSLFQLQVLQHRCWKSHETSNRKPLGSGSATPPLPGPLWDGDVRVLFFLFFIMQIHNLAFSTCLYFTWLCPYA